MKKKKNSRLLCAILYWLNGVTPVAADLSRIAHTKHPTMVNCAKFDRRRQGANYCIYIEWTRHMPAILGKTFLFFRFWLVPNEKPPPSPPNNNQCFECNHIEIEQNNENKELFLLSFLNFFLLERRNYAKSESARCDTVVLRYNDDPKNDGRTHRMDHHKCLLTRMNAARKIDMPSKKEILAQWFWMCIIRLV